MSLRSGRTGLSSPSKALQIITRRAYVSHGHEHDHSQGYSHHQQPHPYTYPPESRLPLVGCFLISVAHPWLLILKALTSRPFQLSAAAILAVLGLNEAGFFDRKDGQHPITKWIKSQHPTDEELLRSRLLTLHRAAKVSKNNRTIATARRPGYQRVKNTVYV